MTKQLGKSITIHVNDFGYAEIKKAALSYSMSPTDYCAAVVQKMTENRIKQIKKDNPNFSAITLTDKEGK